MKCFTCNHENTQGSKFCSNCGKDFQSKNSFKKTNQQEYPHQESVKMHENYMKERANSPVVVIAVMILFLFLAFLFSGGKAAPTMVAGIVITLIGLSAMFATKIVREPYYYSLPGSRDSNGEHRCIFCGHKGLYKSTVYKTTTTVNACSKCKKELFRN